MAADPSPISAQEQWKEKTLRYVADVNAFVAKGLKDGWDAAGKEPAHPQLNQLAKAALAAVQEANETGQLEGLRDKWPPSHISLIELLMAKDEENAEEIPVVCLLDDGSIVARIGAYYRPGRTVQIKGNSVSDVPDVGFFGRSPNRRYFAIAREAGVEIVEGWKGPKIAMCPWPTGKEGVPGGVPVAAAKDIEPSRLIPFPDGTRVLLACSHGVFILSPQEAKRLLPTSKELAEDAEHMAKEKDTEPMEIGVSMEHGAISTDGRLIAVGDQDSNHLVFNERLEQVADIYPFSSYPHYAAFSADQSVIAFNSCHFYNGTTIDVPVKMLPELKTPKDDAKLGTLQDGARVYAAVSRNDEFIIGDASGYIRATSLEGKFRWQQFLGSTICDMDISPDGKTLVVSSAAGFLAIYRLDTEKQAPHQIGTGNHLEERRWIFWKSLPRPLAW